MALSLDTTIGAGGIIIAESHANPSTTTASFSTAANVRLVALAACNGDTSSTLTISTSGGGITWAREVQEVTREGAAEIWVAYSAAALSAQTVTVTQNGTGGLDQSVTVVGILGAESTHGGGEATASSASGTATCNVTSTRDGSYILACMSDWAAITGTNVSGSSPAQTLLNIHEVAGQYTGAQSRSTNTVTAGTQTMAYSPGGRNYNLCTIEIREATAAAAGLPAYDPVPFIPRGRSM